MEAIITNNCENNVSSGKKRVRIKDSIKHFEEVQEIKKKSRKQLSGHCYFEEKLRKKRIQEYNRELKEALKRRKLWKQFQKELEKEVKLTLIRSSGPEWWQEPSRNQISLTTCLGDVIKADKEEGVTGRTRQWLLDLGVSAHITPKEVRTCMKRSLLNPVDFLLEVHDVIAKSAEKKKGHLEKPFSLDERLLLSAVCVLQLPTLLTMLHYILPPTEPLSESTFVQELLYGDLNDESIRYASPYMEPLPFRNQDDFKAWAFDRVYKALLPSVIESIPKDQMSESVAVRKMSTTPMTLQVLSKIIPKLNNSIGNQSEDSSIPTVLWLMSHYVSNSHRSSSVITMFHQNSQETGRNSFSRQLTKKIKKSIRSQKQDFTDNPIQNQTLKINSKENSNLAHKDQEEFEFSNKQSDIPDCPTNNAKQQTMHSIINNVEVNKEDSSSKLSKHGKPQDSFIKKIGLQSVLNEIRAMPEDQQLQHAITVLANLGDPLAQLPRVYKLPSVKRWLELRQGKKRILTKQEKDELLSVSRKSWRSNVVGNMKEIPKVKCTKRQERLLTWDKKNWLTSEVTKELASYCSRLRTQKVVNARAFFQTMFNHYDHGSKLNRNFRDVYFTYLPAREADLKVFRPWKPDETMGSRDLQK